MGVAVKVTELPAQTGFADDVIFTETGNNGFTIIVMVFDVAGLLVVHKGMDEVNTQFTTSLFSGV